MAVLHPMSSMRRGHHSSTSRRKVFLANVMFEEQCHFGYMQQLIYRLQDYKQREDFDNFCYFDLMYKESLAKEIVIRGRFHTLYLNSFYENRAC